MQNTYTDTENTGAPLVPLIETSTAADDVRVTEHEEAVLSHRIQH